MRSLQIKVTVVLIVSLFLLINTFSFAYQSEDFHKQRAKAEAIVQPRQKPKLNMDEDKDQFYNQLAKVNIRLQIAEEKIRNLQLKIPELEISIAETQERIDQLEGEIAGKQSAFEELIITMDAYKHLEYLLWNAAEMDDFLSQSNTAQILNEDDRELIVSLKNDKREKQSKEKQLEDQQFRLQESMTDEGQAWHDLELAAIEKIQLMEDISSELIATKEEIQALHEDAKSFNNEIHNEEKTIALAKAQAAEEIRLRAEAEAIAEAEATQTSNQKPAFYDSSDGELVWPVPSCHQISEYYSYRLHPVTGGVAKHIGLDIPAGTGESIVAADDGIITYAGVDDSYGNVVYLSHNDGKVTVYAHASEIYVSNGDYVNRGQEIAAVGSTGMSTGSHLHFELRIDGMMVDPLFYLLGQ